MNTRFLIILLLSTLTLQGCIAKQKNIELGEQLVLGTQADSLIAKLGTPDKVQPWFAGDTIYEFRPCKGGFIKIISDKNGIVVSVKVRGESPNGNRKNYNEIEIPSCVTRLPYDNRGVWIGSSIEKLRSRFGIPNEIKEYVKGDELTYVYENASGAEQTKYGPITIAFEVAEEKVLSMIAYSYGPFFK